MITDRRELILARTFELLQDISGFNTVVRNRGILQLENDLENPSLPACYLLDAHEQGMLGQEIGGGPRLPSNRPIKVPDLMSMSPEIYVQEVLVKPHNEGIGGKLNGWRIKILNALFNDQQLQDYVAVPNGTIRYMGCTTDLAAGQSFNGQMKIMITFVYPVVFSELLESS